MDERTLPSAGRPPRVAESAGLLGRPSRVSPTNARWENDPAGRRKVPPTLGQAVEAGGDDLAGCAAGPRRPIPYAAGGTA